MNNTEREAMRAARAAQPAAPAVHYEEQPDCADIIAGSLQCSRGDALQFMREQLLHNSIDHLQNRALAAEAAADVNETIRIHARMYEDLTCRSNHGLPELPDQGAAMKLTKERISEVIFSVIGIALMDDEVGQVASAIEAELEKQAGWRPIETAPKDGTILVYWVASIRYVEDEETGQLHEVDESSIDMGCWVDGGEHSDGYHDPFGGIPGDAGGVTHWMPLPAPPSPSGTTEGGE